MLTTDLAIYVLSLEDATARTARQEDLQLYQTFRAHAGYLLALAVVDAEAEKLNETLEAHEALWTKTMLLDDAYKGPAKAWQKVKDNA
jgi:hypothetical protein